MSNLEDQPDLQFLDSSQTKIRRIIPPRQISLHNRSGALVNRTLPHRHLRSIGPWCFIDQFGPVLDKGAMRVAAHPHTGLQTVTWLFSGSVLHEDSLGSHSEIRLRELNLMTAGYGVAHSELSIDSQMPLHGAQLWVALPEDSRNTSPSFEHVTDLPSLEFENSKLTVFAGRYLELRSPAKFYSEIVGIDVEINSSEMTLALQDDWEYGILNVYGEFSVDSQVTKAGELLYLDSGNTSVRIVAFDQAKFLLLGGAPLNEPIIMWWNFIARSHEEIVEMRNAWEGGSSRFPEFESRIGERIPAPALPNIRLAPRWGAR